MRAAHTTQRFSTIVALLAMVLLLVAPLISKMVLQHENAHHSQAMPERSRAPAKLTSAESLTSATALLSAHTHEPAHAHHGQDTTHAHRAATDITEPQHEPSGESNHHPAHDSACDYCELLLHSPLLLWAAACLLWLRLLLRQLVFTPKPTPAPLPSWRALRQPRAPPRFILSLTH